MASLERVNLGLSILALLIAVGSLGFSWYVWRDSEMESRPHINIRVSLYETRLGNGIVVANSGLMPAKIYSLNLHDDIDNSVVKGAILDMNSVGFLHDHIIRHAYQQEIVVHPGGDVPLLSIDKNIGLTDIQILDRRFSETRIDVCYCTVSDANCWKYSWLYKLRDNGLRGEVPVKSCSAAES
ncbi:MAG: hypothetical protein ABL311_15775 [Nitratireductor rhodophyticola]|uniref:hypothetical protein n=2 Tax=Nitratireductor rhodophyticola TaxID=2854036 RepID=UPI0032D98F8E